MNRQAFYNYVNRYVFSNRMSNKQGEGISYKLDSFLLRGFNDSRMLASLLTTSYFVTDTKMMPVRGSMSIPIGSSVKGYDRIGEAMIEGKKNYMLVERATGNEVYKFPELMTYPKISSDVLVCRMFVSIKGVTPSVSRLFRDKNINFFDLSRETVCGGMVRMYKDVWGKFHVSIINATKY